MMETSNSIEIPNKRYFTIGEVSKITHIKTHILRYWEKEFEVLEPIKRKGNRRYYTQNDILTILKINDLISSHGFTIEGAKQKLLSTSNSSSTEDHTLLLLKKDIEKIIDVLDK
jgi:DNA-binding transcriptional MerR regulator